ncbi:glycoside hydrolase domain-containing protein [Trueperella pyogenes]|uniref:glycoside hydrolase domain-containing protein n=1 Tax=Trueperella pyogenes TaxID=1661 RepID=UPI000A949B46|nr:glycoside hydrolase domain-containing protein [Trueperella pyogenes]
MMGMKRFLGMGAVASIAISGLLAIPFARPALAEDSALGPLTTIAKWHDDIPGGTKYRIPALTQAPNEDLLAIYDMRPSQDDLASNIGVVMRRSKDDGATWGPVQTIRYETGKRGNGDPSVLVDRKTGRIFVFYAGTENQGLSGASAGNKATDPNTMQVVYSYSDDNGATWQHRNITAETKPANWAGIFAASGEGIQLRSPAHEGRLIQQYVVKIDGSLANVSLFSDDAGRTWSFGEPFRHFGDENKVVELSDGTLMMSARVGGGMRGVAYSADGGKTWREGKKDGQQIDPTSNGTILRIYPDAKPGDPKAKMLMLLNSEDPNIRRNGTAKVSCDDGQTWPGRLTIEPNESYYITGTPIYKGGQATGKVGILVEREAYTTIAYTALDTTRMNMVCAPISAQQEGTESTPAKRISVVAGERATLPLTITNQGTQTLTPAQVSVTGYDKSEWTTTNSAAVPQIAPGQSVQVDVVLDVPDTLLGERTLVATYDVGGKTSQQLIFVTVTGEAKTPTPKLLVEPYLDATYEDGSKIWRGSGPVKPGPVGDIVVPWVRVTNVGNVPVENVKLNYKPEYCHQHRMDPGTKILPNSTYNPGICWSRDHMRHEITEQDVERGYWEQEFYATFTYEGKTYESNRGKVRLELDRESVNPSRIGKDKVRVYLPTGDFQSSSFTRMPDDRPNSWILPTGHNLGLEMAKDNRTSAQLVVVSPKAGTLTAEVSEAAGITWEVSYPDKIVNSDQGKLQTGQTLDPLRTAAPRVEPNKNQAVWFVGRVAPEAKAGVINQEITLKLDGRVIATYPVSVTVRDVQLLDRSKRPFTLDLWWQPDAIADWYGVKPWSPEHFAHMKPYLRELASAQQEVVNVAIAQDPWYLPDAKHAQTASPYNSTVEWRWDGKNYAFNFDVFDKVVQAHADAGITGPIHTFGIKGFKQERLTYVDDTQGGKLVSRTIELGGEDYRQAWGSFLNAFEKHLKEKGWFERTQLFLDEPKTEQLAAIESFINDDAPAWQGKLALAANSVNEANKADFVAFNYSLLDKLPVEVVAQRADQGKQSLFYTYYEPQRPNVIAASPLHSGRMLGWIAQKRNLDGFLRWSFNSWPTDVYANSTYRYHQGDEYLIYPGGTKAKPEAGPVSSMRWESFRDGIDDAEIVREATMTKGIDAAEFQRVLTGFGDKDAGSANTWAAMVAARSIALNAIGAQVDGQPRMTAQASTMRVTPGSPVKVSVKVHAPLADGLDPVTVAASAPQGWQITPATAKTGAIAANRSGTVEFWVANNYGDGEGTIAFTANAAGHKLAAEVTLTASAGECVPASLVGKPGTNSEEPTKGLPSEGPVALAFDGNPGTHWHSEWNGHAYPIDAWWRTDAAPGQELCAVTYQSRQTGTNGHPSEAKIYTSADGQDWHEVATVKPNNSKGVQRFDLPAGTTGPWVKFSITKAASTVAGKAFGSAAEFGAVKKVASAAPPVIVDTVEDGKSYKSYEIPDNGIQYVVNGKPATPGVHEAKPGQKVEIKMNGLAEHGYSLPKDAPVDWAHTFLGVEAPAVTAKIGQSLPATALKVHGNAGALTFALGAGAPAWLSVSEDGAITGDVPSDASIGKLSIPVTVTEVLASSAPKTSALPGTFTATATLVIDVVDAAEPAQEPVPGPEPAPGPAPVPGPVGPTFPGDEGQHQDDMNMTPHPLQDPSVSASAPKSESGLAWTGAAVVGLAVMSLVFLLAGFVMTVRRRKA